ncbi:LysR family transcriptional regulator [Streptomyces sp. SCA3-4]|uniref:LysR family transcriptional regulator n=1 Tax=Streptomyces sichuanensis TaxID=2871810 RepID=UPI001CE32AEE|nr:LysR family transcriptional regulator [Streptomyces sichuanensis]MCA6094909.1 LysR family transcriptional regulator [Streptomyces sichuanensis]
MTVVDEFQPAPGTDDVDDVDMRHLRYFLAVVRAGTVSAAAQELHISQPSLSQQIRRLERRVGAPLFHRSSRGVELTPGGRAFLHGVRDIPGRLRSAIAAAAPAPADLPVGICHGVPAEVLAEIQCGLTGRSARPDGAEGGPAPRLTMRSVHSASQLELLQHGELAFGVVRIPIDAEGLVLATVWDEPLGIVLHSEHPLTARPALTWADLAAQRLLWFDTGCAPGYAEAVLSQLAALGWQPEVHPMDHDQQALFVHALQSTPDLVALRPQPSVHGYPQLTWRPLPPHGAPRERLALAALDGGPHARTLRRVAAARYWPLGR